MSTIPVRVGVGVDPFAPTPTRDDWFAAIDLMEELGVDSVWLADSATLGGFAPLPALAAAASRTERLKLGIGVLVLPARNPLMLARELATIDVLSGGRLLPAGGLGVDLPAELEAMGVRREDRVGRLEESVAIIKALWPGEPVTYHGKHWSLTDVRLTPGPVRSKLEMWLGGRAPAALRRVGRIADGWLAAAVSPDEFEPMTDVIRAAAADAGRSIDADHYGATVFAAPSPDEVPPAAMELLTTPGPSGQTQQVAYGTAALRELLERFVAAGASKFVVIPSSNDPLTWLRELYTEVIEPLEAEAAVAPRV